MADGKRERKFESLLPSVHNLAFAPSTSPTLQDPAHATVDAAGMVRLLTQNLIACPAKTCSFPSNFPLTFTDVEKVEIIETEFNEEFLRGYLNRIEWNALRKSAAEVRREETTTLEDGG